MSITRQHADWLSLVESSGPFLSMPVLLKVFPQGLETIDSGIYQNIKLAYQEWFENNESLKPDPAIHNAWIKYVLNELLEYDERALKEGSDVSSKLQTQIPEYQEILKPDMALVDPSDNEKARLLIKVYPSKQDLNKPIPGSYWKVSPATRMMELLHATDIRLGLITNGEHWMLVNAPKGESTGYISWYAHLWVDEKVMLQSFNNLLKAGRFFASKPSEAIEDILEESSKNQEDVTNQLGNQVRKAVEIIVAAIDKIDQDKDRKLLEGISEKELYAAALTVMMRLVFLFCAEERRLLLLGDPVYDQNYAVSTLSDQLRETADQIGEEVLERRHDAWSRLLATFRVVFAGIEHDRLRLPAYDGGLFDPDRYPFLEGRKADTCWLDHPAEPMPINNRIVLHLIEALQVLQMEVPGGGKEARRLSFRALDIEQIGHVYEGLLDHTAVIARDVVLGFDGTKNKEPEIELGKLEEYAAKSEDALIEFLYDQTGRGKTVIPKLLNFTNPEDNTDLLIACQNKQDIYKRILPYVKLLRKDTLDDYVVIMPGSIFVTQGSERRKTGTHYTPRILTEEVVKHTLDPIVFKGPAEGKPEEEWELITPQEILDLKICDFAMGSGAFLVQACRYLSEKLVESWEKTAEKLETPEITIYGEKAKNYTDSIPAMVKETKEAHENSEDDERLLLARRLIANRCLYGVDKNPLAVEMAKLSLWLITMQKEKPFTFLDHSLKCGDSLLGITDEEQIKYFHIKPEKEGNQLPAFENFCAPALKLAIDKRKELEGFQSIDITDAQKKIKLHKEAEKALEDIKLIGDLIIGAALSTADKSEAKLNEKLLDLNIILNEAYDKDLNYFKPGKASELKRKAQKLLNEGKPDDQADRKPFHWLVEFPEVFNNGKKGFDALVGNPPFLHGQKLTGTFGNNYREHLVKSLANEKRGSADLCSYFFLRTSELLNKNGALGLLATNTIAQGDTREVGLDQLFDYTNIYRAFSSQKWPGVASIEVAVLWITNNNWNGKLNLDNKIVDGITPSLTEEGKVKGNPEKLYSNQEMSYQGSIVLGDGFYLEPEEAEELIKLNPKNEEVIYPYLSGDDFNKRLDQSHSRYVINFFDWPVEKAKNYAEPFNIILEKVKPKRDKDNRKQYRDKWWHYAEKRPKLYKTIGIFDRVLFHSFTSKYLCFGFAPTEIVYAGPHVVIALQENKYLAILQSFAHECWVFYSPSTLENRLRYTASDYFETFPFPLDLSSLDELGEKYHLTRKQINLSRQIGLTDLYNLYHNPDIFDEDIVELRNLKDEINQEVAKCYDWLDLDLTLSFNETKQGLRYTISEKERQEVYERLLELNHERYAEEVAQGLHDKKKSSSKKKASKPKTDDKKDSPQLSLFK